MKKLSVLSAIGLLSVLINFTAVYAQGGKNLVSSEPAMYNHSLAELNLENDRLALNKLKLSSPVVFKKFTRSYPNAENLSVFEKQGFMFIHFSNKGVSTRVMYSARGSWKSTLEFLNASQIPKGITGMINRQFPKAKINGATYIIVPEGKAHLVYIQTVDKFITVRIVDSEWDIYKSFDRQF